MYTFRHANKVNNFLDGRRIDDRFYYQFPLARRDRKRWVIPADITDEDLDAYWSWSAFRLNTDFPKTIRTFTLDQAVKWLNAFSQTKTYRFKTEISSVFDLIDAETGEVVMSSELMTHKEE